MTPLEQILQLRGQQPTKLSSSPIVGQVEINLVVPPYGMAPLKVILIFLMI